MAFFEADFLNFFKELAPNNHKDWFDLNRKRYESSVKNPFKAFVEHLIVEFSKKDKAYENLEAKDCIFRINRDVRFAKDKQPYKLMVSAVISPGGKKSRAIEGVYFELTPEHVRVYGGIYEAEKADLYDVREGIAQHLAQFKKLYSDASFKAVYGEIQGAKNKVIPKEFKEAAATEDLIFNKQWYFYTQFEAETVLRPDLDKIILDAFEVGRPVSEFLNSLINKQK